MLAMESSALTDPPVSEFAGQLFFRLWRAAHVRSADVLGTLGLTPALFGLLNVIGAREGANQQELGAAMGIDRSTMVSLIDQLEDAALAKRRPSPTDPPRPGDHHHPQGPPTAQARTPAAPSDRGRSPQPPERRAAHTPARAHPRSARLRTRPAPVDLRRGRLAKHRKTDVQGGPSAKRLTCAGAQ